MTLKTLLKNDTIQLLYFKEAWDKLSPLGRSTIYPIILIELWVVLLMLCFIVPLIKLSTLIERKTHIWLKTKSLFMRPCTE